MIVQTAPEGAPNLIVLQAKHARLSGQFAEAFGNEEFTSLTPRDAMEYVAGHHDEGWVTVDSRMEQDVETGLPYHLTQTPLLNARIAHAASPTLNETYHPYSGLLASMHSYGLYNGRYGLSDRVFMEQIPAENRDATEAMLRAELDRQERLLNQLHLHQELARWISEAYLFHNYKLLQFFDTLSLYFTMGYPMARTRAEFPNVPRAVGDDVTITLEPLRTGLYTLSPYPFHQDSMTFYYDGRFLSPQPAGTDLRQVWENAERHTETIRLVRT